MEPVRRTRIRGVERRSFAGLLACRAGSRSSPSGFDRNPGAEEAVPKWPYCQTIRFVRGSMTTMR